MGAEYNGGEDIDNGTDDTCIWDCVLYVGEITGADCWPDCNSRCISCWALTDCNGGCCMNGD